MDLSDEIIHKGIECRNCPNETREVSPDGTISACAVCGDPENYISLHLPEPVDVELHNLP